MIWYLLSGLVGLATGLLTAFVIWPWAKRKLRLDYMQLDPGRWKPEREQEGNGE